MQHLTSRRRAPWLLAALLGLGTIAACIVLVYAAAKEWGWLDPAQIAFRARQTGLDHLGTYVAGSLYWITLNSLLEEYVWRWFCSCQCEALFGSRWGVVASGAGFTLHHIIALAGQLSGALTLLGSLGVFCGGTGPCH